MTMTEGSLEAIPPTYGEVQSVSQPVSQSVSRRRSACGRRYRNEKRCARAPEKDAKAQNSVFFQTFVAPEIRKVTVYHVIPDHLEAFGFIPCHIRSFKYAWCHIPCHTRSFEDT